jgi:flagellar biosynthesis GTPase FlhF
VFALGAPEDRVPLAARLEPLGLHVHGARDADAARETLDRLEPDVTLIDTPSLGPADPAAARVLGAQLRALAVDEVHLALPAPISAAAAAEAHRALRPLGTTHAALTHADVTAYPGAAVEAAIDARLALSYQCARATVSPVDPADLAARLV